MQWMRTQRRTGLKTKTEFYGHILLDVQQMHPTYHNTGREKGENQFGIFIPLIISSSSPFIPIGHTHAHTWSKACIEHVLKTCQINLSGAIIGPLVVWQDSSTVHVWFCDLLWSNYKITIIFIHLVLLLELFLFCF